MAFVGAQGVAPGFCCVIPVPLGFRGHVLAREAINVRHFSLVCAYVTRLAEYAVISRDARSAPNSA